MVLRVPCVSRGQRSFFGRETGGTDEQAFFTHDLLRPVGSSDDVYGRMHFG